MESLEVVRVPLILYSNDNKVGSIENSGREADRKDGLVYPDSVYIFSCKQKTDIMTELWDLC